MHFKKLEQKAEIKYFQPTERTTASVAHKTLELELSYQRKQRSISKMHGKNVE